MKRQRWQNDVLDRQATTTDSSTVTEEQIRKSDADGKLRQDPNGNLITSATESNEHYPIIDLDVPHIYVPSRTEGHGHLYINRALSFEAYREIIEILVKHKLVGRGNLLQLDIRGHSGARLPKDFEDRRPFYERVL